MFLQMRCWEIKSVKNKNNNNEGGNNDGNLIKMTRMIPKRLITVLS